MHILQPAISACFPIVEVGFEQAFDRGKTARLGCPGSAGQWLSTGLLQNHLK